MFAPSLGRIISTTVALALGAVLALGSMLALSSPARAQTAPMIRLVASDNMHRHVITGLGSAHHGGHYAVSALRGARVLDRRAILGPVRPGHSVSAWLPHLHVGDTHVRTSFHLASRTPLGGGEYFDIGLRREWKGASYLAKIRVLPGRGVMVALTRMQDGRETVLGSEHQALRSSAAAGWINIDAVVEGTYPVNLAMRIWRSGSPTPTRWQATYSDRSVSRLRSPGSVAFTSYLSRTARGTSTVNFSHVRVWKELRRTLHLRPAPVTPPVTTSPVTTPPVSTPPVTTPPVTTPPVTTPPVTTPPVSTPPVTTPPVSTPPVTTPPVTTPPVTTPPVTTPPASNSAVGSAPLGSTSYTYPANAVFVSPSGSDSSSGTISNPLQTLGKALSVAPAGGTVVMRAGIYNETVQDINKPLTVQSYPGEVVWLDGSTAVTGWTQQGSTWVHSGWLPQFSSIPSYTATPSNVPGFGFVNSAHPMAAHPDQMWMDGTALTQVATAADVKPGTFFADYADDELVIGSDPTSHAMRASNLGIGLTSYAPNFTVRGIGVRNYATAVNAFGALRLLGKSDTAENVVSINNATTGIMLNTDAPTINHVTVSNNGMLGMTGTYVNGATFNGVLAENNNTEGFNMAPVSGGVKIARTRGVSVSNSRFAGNAGPGLWFDESVYGATVVNNTMVGNANHGMSYEISSTALIANNFIQGNNGWGIKINNSDHVRAWNNCVLGNGAGGIWVVEDSRRGTNMSDAGHNPQRAQPDATEPWTITDDSVMNNVFSGAKSQLYVFDSTGQYSADDLNLSVSGNQFQQGVAAYMIVWGHKTGNPAVFSSAANFDSTTGQQANSDVTPSQSLMGNPGGMPLPADVAAAIGQTTGAVHLGVF